MARINNLNKTRDLITAFGGLNASERHSDNEWSKMLNMSADRYPLLSARAKRDYENIGEDTRSIVFTPFGIARLWWDDTEETDWPMKFTYTKDSEDKTVTWYGSGNPTQLVCFGTKVINPETGTYFDLLTEKFTDMRNEQTIVPTNTIKIYCCDGDYNNIANIQRKAIEPSNPSNGDYWYDMNNHGLKRYSSTTGMWVSVATAYAKIQTENPPANDWTTGFNVGDVVKIDGTSWVAKAFANDKFGDGEYIVKVGHRGGKEDDGTTILNPYIIVRAIMTTNVRTTQESMTIYRDIPPLEHLIVANNRVYCCYNGEIGGKYVNEIYASKLGDCTNWKSFQGISTDSYAVTVGAGGNFTGAINFDGTPFFFKEDRVYALYGSYPAQFQLKEYTCEGAVANSFVSHNAVVCGGSLYYMTYKGLARFNANVPTFLADDLGDMKLFASDVNMLTVGEKIYIQPYERVGSKTNTKMYVYDTKTNIWTEEDTEGILFQSTRFAVTNGNGVSYLSLGDTNGHDPVVIKYDDSKINDSKGVKWWCESELFGTDTPDNSYVSKLNLRFESENPVTIAFMYDESGDYVDATDITCDGLKPAIVPLIPRRCAVFRYRLEGEGDFKLYSISKTVEEGSDL